MAVPTLPAPAMATFMPASGAVGVARRCSRSWNRSRASLGDHEVEDVAVLADEVGEVEADDAGPGDRHQGDLARAPTGRRGACPPSARAGGARRATTLPVGSDHSVSIALGQQLVADLVDGPGHGGHGGDAQAQVDLGPAGVVDAGHHVGDPVGLPGDAGREDVGVVPAGHGGEGRRPRCALACVEVVAVEAGPDHGRARPVGRQPAEGLGVAVDDGHRVALGGEVRAQAGTDPAAADDDDVHGHHATRIDTSGTTHRVRAPAAGARDEAGVPGAACSNEGMDPDVSSGGDSVRGRRPRIRHRPARGAPAVDGAAAPADGVRRWSRSTFPRRSATG